MKCEMGKQQTGDPLKKKHKLGIICASRYDSATIICKKLHRRFRREQDSGARSRCGNDRCEATSGKL